MSDILHEADRDNKIRFLLAALGRKYDQYLDFAQQDAHEFLRILLDAMRMEEFDVSTALYNISSRIGSFIRTRLSKSVSRHHLPKKGGERRSLPQMFTRDRQLPPHKLEMMEVNLARYHLSKRTGRQRSCH